MSSGFWPGGSAWPAEPRSASAAELEPGLAITSSRPSACYLRHRTQGRTSADNDNTFGIAFAEGRTKGWVPGSSASSPNGGVSLARLVQVREIGDSPGPGPAGRQDSGRPRQGSQALVTSLGPGTRDGCCDSGRGPLPRAGELPAIEELVDDRNGRAQASSFRAGLARKLR